MFHGVCVGVTYFLARLPADPRACVRALALWCGHGHRHAPCAEAHPQYVIDNVAMATTILSQRLAWDPLKALGMGGAFALLHITGVLHKATPTLLWVSACGAIMVGFGMHYLRTELSRPYPFKLFKTHVMEATVLQREGRRARRTGEV